MDLRKLLKQYVPQIKNLNSFFLRLIFFLWWFSALNSKVSLEGFPSKFKELSLGCLVIGFSLIQNKENKLKRPLVASRCHSLSLVVTRYITSVSFYNHSVFCVLSSKESSKKRVIIYGMISRRNFKRITHPRS